VANKWAITGGGTWNGATWATSSNQSVSDTTKPTATDNAYMDEFSGNVTLTANEGARTVVMSGYANTLDIPKTMVLTLQNFGSILGGTITGGGAITLQSGATLSGTATSFGTVTLNVTGCVLSTGVDCEWAKIVQASGVITFAGSVATVHSEVLTLWASGTQRLYVSGNQKGGSVTGPSGTPIIVMCGTGTFGTTTLTLGCDVEIDTFGTITFGASVRFGTSIKTFTYIRGNVDTSACVVGVFGAYSFDTSGMTFANVVFSGTASTTLSSAFNATIIDNNRATLSFAGASPFAINCDTFTSVANSTTRLKNGSTLTAAHLYFSGNDAIQSTFTSTTSGQKAFVNFTGGEDDYRIMGTNMGDIEFTSPRKMYNWFGTNTRVTNCDVADADNTRLVMPQLVEV